MEREERCKETDFASGLSGKGRLASGYVPLDGAR